ncbi:MAG: hypothetical protein KJ949_01895 [Nanoarchaeota archaeon]|nr:hypothetical protein [Nanoarchaeota archaeon]
MGEQIQPQTQPQPPAQTLPIMQKQVQSIARPQLIPPKNNIVSSVPPRVQLPVIMGVPPQEPVKKKKWWIWLILGIVLLVIGFIIFGSSL